MQSHMEDSRVYTWGLGELMGQERKNGQWAEGQEGVPLR